MAQEEVGTMLAPPLSLLLNLHDRQWGQMGKLSHDWYLVLHVPTEAPVLSGRLRKQPQVGQRVGPPTWPAGPPTWGAGPPTWGAGPPTYRRDHPPGGWDHPPAGGTTHLQVLGEEGPQLCLQQLPVGRGGGQWGRGVRDRSVAAAAPGTDPGPGAPCSRRHSLTSDRSFESRGGDSATGALDGSSRALVGSKPMANHGFNAD